jgi:hypothetical protein
VCRFGFGKLFGHRFLLLVHEGRKSGLRREAVLEVVRYDLASRECVALSGRGEEADWQRNTEAHLAHDTRTWGERHAPAQRFLAPEENHAIISYYARRHSLVFRFLTDAFGFGHPPDGTGNERRRFVDPLRLVAFRPKDETNKRGPLGERTDTTRREVMK